MKLNYKKYGDAGDHLIILHGLFGMLDNWHTLATKFSDSFQVWTIDQRNHGKSTHSDEFDYDLLAEDLNSFMQEHKIEKAHLIGHSMGGKTVMQFALKYPEKVDKLIVADIAPKAYASRHDTILEALENVALKGAERREDIDDRLAKKIDEPSVRQFLMKNLTRTQEGYKWKMNLNSLIENYDKIIGAIDKSKTYDGPTLFIAGGRSNYIQDEDKEAIREQFTDAKFITLKEAGHWLHAEAPDLFEETVRYFLSR